MLLYKQTSLKINKAHNHVIIIKKTLTNIEPALPNQRPKNPTNKLLNNGNKITNAYIIYKYYNINKIQNSP